MATLNVNVAANVVSPSNDISNLNPRLISFRTGGLITGFLGLAMMPWKLMASFNNYIFGWLVGYSALLGPVAGIMVADYFLIRGTRLDLESLYRRGGIYEYSNGINPRAMIALAAGVVCALIGRFVPALHWLLRLCVVCRILRLGCGVCRVDAGSAERGYGRGVGC